MEDRNVDPFLQRGYNRGGGAEYKLHNYTEKIERDYFESMFPLDLIMEIATLMTAHGRLLGLGSEWTVSNGDVIGFLAYNFAILMFHTEGPMGDLWLSETTSTY